MAISLLDSEIYGSNWQTPEMREIFDERKKIEVWLLILSTLAKCQADLKLIPQIAADEIAKASKIENISLADWKKNFNSTGHSIMGLINTIEPKLGTNGRVHFCYGATVQDITDTWLSMALIKVHGIVERLTLEIIKDLTHKTDKYKKTLMAGRTHGQIGSPISFGFKVAVWLAEFHRHLTRLKEVKQRIGFSQLSGAVGAMTGFSEIGIELQKRFSHELGLRVPLISWTCSRDSIVEALTLYSWICASCEKIGNEIYNLQRSEVAEIHDDQGHSQVGSITMPHKINPERAEHIGTLSKIIRSEVSALNSSLAHEHERDGKEWKVEWMLIPSICTMIGACLKITTEMLPNIEVKSERMQKNALDELGLFASERLMFSLAKNQGIAPARESVRNLCKKARESQIHLRKVCELEKLNLTAMDLDSIFDPHGALAGCYQMIGRVASFEI